MKTCPKVAIIILNWNGREDTIECLESLKQITYPNYEILLVDNGSTDGYVDFFKERYPYAEIIENGENVGFAEGNNVGILRAMVKGVDYVLLLNNDTVVDSEFLSELVKTAEVDEKIGIVGPKTYYANPMNMIYYAGAKINWYTGQAKHIGQKKIDNGDFNEVKDVDFIAGSCMLIKKEVIEKIGTLPTDYFLLWEDIDYSVNAIIHGYKLVYVPNSIIWHKASVSIKKINNKRIYYSMRNRLIFLKKYSTKIQYFCSLICLIFCYGPINLLYLYIKSIDINAIRFYYKGFFEGLRYNKS